MQKSKKEHFYSHIIEIESIHVALSELDLEDHEKSILVNLVETNIHHVVMDTVMSELSEKDKTVFLQHLVSEKHDEVWELLDKKMPESKKKIKQAVKTITDEMHNDIKTSKKKKHAHESKLPK